MRAKPAGPLPAWARAGAAGAADRAREQAAALATLEAAARACPAARQHRQRQDRGLPARGARALADRRQALVLVPEINLTPQLEARFAERLPGAACVLAAQRADAGAAAAHWLRAAGRADLVLGTRMAVFASMPRLG
jgi:primosomal protein N' (replication factor Y)